MPLRDNPSDTARARAPTQQIRDSPYAPMYEQALELTHDTADRLRRGQETSSCGCSDNFTLLGARADAPDPADGLPRGGQARLLPAVLRDDGADAAHGRHPGPRGGRLLARLLQQGHAASTACATSTRTPGSRSGSPGSAGCRSTRRRRARPRRSQSSALATSAAAADARRGADPPGAAAASTPRRASAAGGDGRHHRRLDPARRDPAAGARARSARAALADRPPHAAACALLRRTSVAAAQLSELRRALDAAGLGPPRVHDAARTRAAARPLRRPELGGLRGRPARQPLRPARARRPEPTAAARGCAASSRAGACSTGSGA